MHTNIILTNKRRTHAQSNYTSTRLKAWFHIIFGVRFERQKADKEANLHEN